MTLAHLAREWETRHRAIQAIEAEADEIAEPLEEAANAHWGLPDRCASLFDTLGDGRLRFYCGRPGGLRTVRVEELER